MSKGRQTEDAWLKRGETEIVPVIILELQHPTLGTKVQISNLQLISWIMPDQLFDLWVSDSFVNLQKCIYKKGY
jgi:hypothetical protein